MENKNSEFLYLFKELEEKLLEASNLKGCFYGFSRCLDECRNKKTIPLLRANKIYNFLRNASDLRNMLSHQNDVCLVTNSFLSEFKNIVEEILNPLDVYDICTKKDKIVYSQLGFPVLDVIDLMVENHLSHIPVLDKGRVIGVFSQATFFMNAYNNRRLKVDETFLIKDYIKLGEYGTLAENFKFISKDLKAYKLLQYLYKTDVTQKRTSVLFITEHGNSNEELLGLITPIDLLKIPYYNYQ